MYDPVQHWFTETLALTAEVTFTLTADDLGETDLVRAFHEHFDDVAFASFRIAGLTPSLRQRLTSCGDGVTGSLDPYGDRLLACPDMHATWPDLAIDRVNDVLAPGAGGGYEVVAPLMLEGRLATALHHGGAHSHASAVDAVRMARNFRQRFCADRYDDVVVLRSAPWSDWFHLVTGDYAWILTDLCAAKVHLLCATGNA